MKSMTHFFHLTLSILLLSCSANKNHQQPIAQHSSALFTKQETDGSVRHYYGKDKNLLDSVIWVGKDEKRVSKEFYLNNELFRVIYYQANGKIGSEQYSISGHLEESEGESYKYFVIEYDTAGNVKAKGIQASFNGMNVPSGTWYKYEGNKLVQEIYYHNYAFGKDYIRYKTYDADGNYKESYSNNFILYENDSIPLTKDATQH